MTSLLKIKWADFFPPPTPRVAYDSCASCSVASLGREKGKSYPHSRAVQGIFFLTT